MAAHPTDTATLVVALVQGLSPYVATTPEVGLYTAKPPAMHISYSQGRESTTYAVEGGRH